MKHYMMLIFLILFFLSGCQGESAEKQIIHLQSDIENLKNQLKETEIKLEDTQWKLKRTNENFEMKLDDRLTRKEFSDGSNEWVQHSEFSSFKEDFEQFKTAVCGKVSNKPVTHMFDAAHVKIGDQVGGMLVTKQEKVQMDHDLLYYRVSFCSGEMQISGTYHYFVEDENLIKVILFYPDLSSLKKLPVSTNISNQKTELILTSKEAIEAFSPTDGEKGRATIVISGFILYNDGKDGWRDNTKFVRLVNKTQNKNNYINKSAAIEIAKKMDPESEAKWEAKLELNKEIEIDQIKEKRTVWTVEASYPAGNKMIVILDAVSGQQLVQIESEAKK